MANNLKLEEQETIIRWMRDETIASIYTCDPTVMTKLDKKVAAHPDAYKLVKQDEYGKWYECPKDRIGFKNPIAPISDERRESMKNIALQNFANRHDKTQ